MNGSADERGRFDSFVEEIHRRVSQASFFTVIVAVILVWLVSFPLFSDAKSWQVVIHTVASIVTLVLVALLENAGRRDARAAQEKLNTIAGALAELMDSQSRHDPELEERARDLREAVGLEERTGT
jgi:low affinity Fe/Cu permease